jgi:hypothetical protein
MLQKQIPFAKIGKMSEYKKTENYYYLSSEMWADLRP